MNWTIRGKLTALCITASATAVVIGVSGFTALRQARVQRDRQLEITAAVRNLLEMDMMHDALRADALAALLAGSPDRRIAGGTRDDPG
jgi:hypothetical protein